MVLTTTTTAGRHDVRLVGTTDYTSIRGQCQRSFMYSVGQKRWHDKGGAILQLGNRGDCVGGIPRKHFFRSRRTLKSHAAGGGAILLALQTHNNNTFILPLIHQGPPVQRRKTKVDDKVGTVSNVGFRLIRCCSSEAHPPRRKDIRKIVIW